MARKKRTTKKRGASRRKYRIYARKVGAVSVQEVAVTLVGAIGSRFLVNSLGKMLPAVSKSAQSKALSQIALGFVTGPVANALNVKSPNVRALANGMMIGGGYELLRVVSPTMLGAADESDVIVVSGSDSMAELNGMDEIGALDEIGSMDISEVNGYEEFE